MANLLEGLKRAIPAGVALAASYSGMAYADSPIKDVPESCRAQLAKMVITDDGPRVTKIGPEVDICKPEAMDYHPGQGLLQISTRVKSLDESCNPLSISYENDPDGSHNIIFQPRSCSAQQIVENFSLGKIILTIGVCAGVTLGMYALYRKAITSSKK